jgi:ferritin
MQWFIKEQVEEVATMSDLLRWSSARQDDPMEIENYMAREHSALEGVRPRPAPTRAPAS